VIESSADDTGQRIGTQASPATKTSTGRGDLDSRLLVPGGGFTICDAPACLWLARGVDPVTVQAWIGHASIATTNLYLHYLGTSDDRAGSARLNDRRQTGRTAGASRIAAVRFNGYRCKRPSRP
jgi:hypothetical protein